MSDPGPRSDTRYAGITAVLVATAAFPLAVLVRNAGVPEPEFWGAVVDATELAEPWPLVALALVALAAYYGAVATWLPTSGDVRRAAREAMRIAACALVVFVTDAAWRVVLHQMMPPASPTAPVDLATLALAVVVATSIYIGRWLADTTRTAIEPTGGGGVIHPVGTALIGGGILTFAAAGLVVFTATAGDWSRNAIAITTATYTVITALHLQRLRRDALIARWDHTGRSVDPSLSDRWSVWTTLIAGMTLIATAAWWLPPLRRLRDGFHLLARIRDARDEPDPITPGIGERVEPFEPDAAPPPATDPDNLVLFAAAALVLIAATALIALLRNKAPRRPNLRHWINHLLTRLRIWARTLLAVLAGMIQRPTPATTPTDTGSATQHHRLARSIRKLRRQRRPARPRDQVVYDYQRLLNDAARHGLNRQAGQPPGRYATVLRDHLPTYTEHIDELTQLFLDARYSDHEITPTDADRARHTSRQLRTALKQ